MSDPHYHRYYMTIHPSGSATCTCMDWLKRGGACKHLRAFRYLIDTWSSNGQLQYTCRFPQSRDEALKIDDQNRHWYRQWYNMAVMTISTPIISTSDNLLDTHHLPKLLDIAKTHIPLLPCNTEIPIPSLEWEAELEDHVTALDTTNSDDDIIATVSSSVPIRLL
jgi:hypothetical protein